MKCFLACTQIFRNSKVYEDAEKWLLKWQSSQDVADTVTLWIPYAPEWAKEKSAQEFATEIEIKSWDAWINSWLWIGPFGDFLKKSGEEKKRCDIKHAFANVALVAKNMVAHEPEKYQKLIANTLYPEEETQPEKDAEQYDAEE